MPGEHPQIAGDVVDRLRGVQIADEPSPRPPASRRDARDLRRALQRGRQAVDVGLGTSRVREYAAGEDAIPVR